MTRAAAIRAASLGCRPVRLPLDNWLEMGDAKRVLTVNHVAELLTRRGGGETWADALAHTLPTRSEVRIKVADQEDGKGAAEGSELEGGKGAGSDEGAGSGGGTGTIERAVYNKDALISGRKRRLPPGAEADPTFRRDMRYL